jgi:hypothetical protein
LASGADQAVAAGLALRVRDELIRDGLADLERTYAPGTPERVGGTVGFMLCETLTTPEDYRAAIDERRAAERQSGIAGADSPEALRVYWEHRHATVQVEYVYERLCVVWNVGATYSAQAVVKVSEILERIQP